MNASQPRTLVEPRRALPDAEQAIWLHSYVVYTERTHCGQVKPTPLKLLESCMVRQGVFVHPARTQTSQMSMYRGLKVCDTAVCQKRV